MTLPVSAVWMRVHLGRIQVLVELDNEWRLVADQPVELMNTFAVSQLTTAEYFRRKPVDIVREHIKTRVE